MIVSYYPLFLMIVGTALNLLTFAVFCRSPFRNVRRQPAIHYMRAIAVVDIFMLYGWNLDHYLSYAYGFTLLRYSVLSCKIVLFINYVSAYISSWLRVFVCFDRCLLLSRLTRTRFNQSKGILIIIGCIVAVFVALNLHLLLFACFHNRNGTVNTQARQYAIHPMWDYVRIGIYSGVPFVLMVAFNSGVVYHLLRIRRESSLRHSRIQHRAISITLVVTTSLFLILTTPSGIIFAFFYAAAGNTLRRLSDGIYFTYHILAFPLYLITFTEFRREFLSMIFYWRRAQRMALMKNAPLQTCIIQRMVG